jgi:hypothetical protein
VIFSFCAAASALAFDIIIGFAPKTSGRSPSSPKPFGSKPSLK